ncbi:MAG: arginine--tRNA ligase [Bacteriovoracaceae bacterium]|nr:arginine--tRNA ligase [Bacteriovoracaceae bacterium]
MKILHDTFLKHLSNKICDAIGVAFPEAQISVEDIYQNISEPPNKAMGQFAFPCFPLAKALRSSPVNISKVLIEHLGEDSIVKSSVLQGPYINFFIRPQAFGSEGIEKILSGEYFNYQLIERPSKMMFEYSQPNTHKELHVGHMRNLCLGNALVRMNRYVGNTVVPSTYPGDVGTHVAKCLWFLKYHCEDKAPTCTEDRGPWLGSLYTKASNKLVEEKDTDKEASNRAELTIILKELEAGKGEYFDLWKETREWSIDLMNKVYKWVDVDFDRWYFESEVDGPSLEFVNTLHKEGKLIESDGAIGMDLKDDKLGFCMLIKSDGTGLYATKDLALAYKKFEEYHLDQSYYIVDKRQAFHFQQVFKVLEKVGFEHSKDCHHLQYDFVELPDGAMSSRKGNIVPLTDLIDKMEQTIVSEYLEKYRGEWSDEEINTTASTIANGAIKYGMIRMDNNRKIVFDMNEWLKLDGETGPYLQYVCARIHSLCEKQGHRPTETVEWSMLEKTQEINLMQKLTQFNSTLELAARQHKTASVCTYLYELGKLFNGFYAECSIQKAESEQLKQARLGLSKATELTMIRGLETLGITAPKKM